MNQHRLKSGKQVYHLNEYETEFLYKELFEDRVYLKQGIRLDSGSVVVDIGANIGLFAVFLHEHVPGCRLILVEPSPVLCAIIAANTQTFADQVNVVAKGISDTRKDAEFTFYPGYSILSGFKADAERDAEVLRAGIRNRLRRLRLNPQREDELIASMLAGKLAHPQVFRAPLIPLDDLFAEQRLERVDLLKIDAEGCEAEILSGLSPTNWKRVRQVVIEVHDPDGKVLPRIVEVLEHQQFRTAVEQEENFTASGISNLYAIRH